MKSFTEGFNEAKSENDENLEWKNFLNEIGYRIKKPTYSPTFWVYFISLTTIMGLTGVFTTIYFELQKCTIDHWNIAFSMGTYFIALISSASADLILNANPVKNAEEKDLRALGICLIIVGIILFLLVSIIKNKLFAYPFAFLGTIVALLAWWLANSNNSNLVKPINPNNANPKPPKEGFSGDENKFNLK